MNKDKAIQLLERLQDPDYYQITSEAFDAIQMAIDALSSDGDTISRKAAVDALVAETIYTKEELKEYYEENSHRDEWVNGIYEAVEAIEQLPPTQPERIKGHWIHKSQVPDTVRGYWATCSSCGRGSFGGGNFCRECGSDNRKEKEK